MSKSEYNYKRHAIRAAKELGYSENVIKRLESATSEAEIERIMNTARKELCQ